MAKLPWHMWARLVTLTAAGYLAWAALWGVLYRKFFWDFVGGTLGPTGIIPPASAKVFEDVIVKAPVLQIILVILNLGVLAFELPVLPLMRGKTTSVQGTGWIWARVGAYFMIGFIAFFPYQTVDGGLYMIIASGVWATAAAKGEAIVPTSVTLAALNAGRFGAPLAPVASFDSQESQEGKGRGMI